MNNWSSSEQGAGGGGLRLSAALSDAGGSSMQGRRAKTDRFIIGVLPGEGVGPELIAVAADLLRVVALHSGREFDIRFGGAIGTVAEKADGAALSPEVINFCESVFSEDGVVLCGPGGGRFVYDLRARFKLFCKFTPVRPIPALQDTGVLRVEAVEGVDMVIVRENTGGLYFGEGNLSRDAATHTFRYGDEEVRRILFVAIRLAQQRRRRLALAVKLAAVKEVSRLWTRIFNELTSGEGLETTVLEVDNANYQIIAAARSFDVLVAPNMFGDILSDGAALLLGSRGMSFSGNFADSGVAVYQTGHGAAYDLAGQDRANPIGQILSAAFMLRESFGLWSEAAAIERAVEQTVAAGVRTRDIAAAGSEIVGTREMGRRIGAALGASLVRRPPV